MNRLTQGLIKLNNEVKVLAMNTPNNFVDLAAIQKSYTASTNIEAVYIDTSIKIPDAFFNLFSDKSYNIQRFISPAFDAALKKILSGSKFDIIQLESLFVVPYLNTIKNLSDAKIVLRAHNVEYEIWERRYRACTNPVKKAYLKLLAGRLKEYETTHLNEYDGIAAITSRDAEIFKLTGCRLPITDIPVGIDVDAMSQDILQKPKLPLSIFHLGSMDWMPNQEAVHWFITKVWQDLKKENPELKLYLAGKNMPDWILEINDDNIIAEGEIKDAFKYMADKHIMIVPILSGSGMRVKIIEGMFLGKVIISTPIGAEGICYENRKTILIAGDKKEFIKLINECVGNPDLCKEIGLNARALAIKEYDNNMICQKLIDFYNTL